MADLEKIKEVPLREIWQHEQYDFSEWLSKEDNLNELGEILHLSLTDVETEKFVGSYRCDILCKDDITGKIVLIELTNIQDPDFGSGYTVKEYRSKKQVTQDLWSHQSITLKPLSDKREYNDIELSEDELSSLKVIGIFECVL